MQIIEKPIEEIQPYEDNPRHNEGAVLYANDYLVYKDGRIYSMLSNKFMIPRIHTSGYHRAYIHGKDEYWHRIIAECFVENPYGYPEVNHKDGDKTNNIPSNLEWCSRAQNNKHAFQTGLRNYSELKTISNSPTAKQARMRRRRLTREQVLGIYAMHDAGMSDTVISEQYGVTRGAIYHIAKGLSYKEVYDEHCGKKAG